ncbi:unnamed protein product, partial [Porites evermanni]
GHNVQEIRVRALKNILFKLDHKLVCAADLVHERQLLINLLQWFNFPNPPLKKEVLSILETLSKPVSGAEGLLSIGAIEFLSHLRQDIDPELYKNVDNVIHQLLSLPQKDAADQDQLCLYKDHENSVKNDHQQSSGTGSVEEKILQTKSTSSSAQLAPFGDGFHPARGTSPVRGFFEEREGHDTTQSSLVSSVKMSHSTETSSSKHDSKSSLTFVPWLSLSASDRHILSVTASRLQSRSFSLVSKSCEFLRNVLFKDFPAEIFLHRPNVLQSLLELLQSKIPIDDDTSIVHSALQCLCDLTHHLYVRLTAVSDPVLFCPDQDCWKYRHISVSVETNSQGTDQEMAEHVRETGDGGVDSEDQSSSNLSDNKASQASDDDDDEDEMVTEALQFNQLSLEEYCVILLARVVPMFRGPLCAETGIIESAVNLLHGVLSLSKRVFPPDLWRSGTQLNSLMATSLINIMKGLSEGITHHMKFYIQLFQDDHRETDTTPSKQSLPIHRLTVVNLATFLMQFLESLIPLEMSSKVIPSEVTTVLWFLSMDELLAITHCHLQPVAMKFLATLDPYSHKLCLFTQDICKSMASTCKFLKTRRVKELRSSLKELCDLVEMSVSSVTYHKHSGFICEAVKICSDVCNPVTGADERAIPICHKIVLQLLAHPDPDVRLQAYKESLNLVKEACSVSHVTEPLSIICQKALFLLNRAVLHQICCFGVYDEEGKISDLALELITTLLLGRLSMSGELWKKLLDGLVVSLPQLQGCVLMDPGLDQCILELVATHGVTGGHVSAEGDIITLPALDRLRGALRLMFVTDSKLRTKGFESVVWSLTNDASREKRKSLVHGILAEKAADLFIVDQITSAVNAHVPVSHTSVDTSEVLNLQSILASSPLDVALRKSSAQQLAVILQDSQWHEPLLKEHTDEVCVAILLEIMEQDGPLHSSTTPYPRMELVPPCLTILRLLAEYNASCRHRLATKYSTYTLVTRCALLCQSSGQVRYEAACLMVLLLFDEVAMALGDKVNSIPFSLPKSLVRRYQFPFAPPVHTPVSVHQVPDFQLKDSLTSEPAVSRLRLAWNLGWHENIENLSRVKGVESTRQSDRDVGYWPVLQWRNLDADLLNCSHVSIALSNQLQCMENASSHYDAKVALSKIMAHLLADKGAKPGVCQRLSVEVFYTLKLEVAFERYLQVVPNSGDDDSLLIELLHVLDIILSSPHQPPEPVVAWVARTVLHRDGPQMTLLRNVQASGANSHTVSESKKALRKHLLSFLVTLVKCLSQYTKGWRLDKERIFIGDLAYALALNLDLADNPQFYDLPVLETSLVCLVHVTAQPHWSSYSKYSQGMSLCLQLMSSLIQATFHAGRLGASSSFMGKGVTYYSSLCLAHLTHEMAVIDPTQRWVSHWLRTQDPQEEPLSWLVPLLTDRWPDIRWTGLSICTSLAVSEQGREVLKVAGQKFVGGLWNFVLSILLDEMECGLVRQQAGLLFCSLVSGLSPANAVTESKQPDQPKNGSKGTQVVLSLLDQFKFFQKLFNMLSIGTFPLTDSHGTNRACQSSATASISSGTDTDIPYKPLSSTSRSQSQPGSVSSEAQTTTTESANGKVSPGIFSVASHTSSTMLSGVSSSAPETQLSRTPTSLVPLINERGLPSGMSSASSSNVSSSAGSTASSGTTSVCTGSSVTPGLIGTMARLLHNVVFLSPGHIISALNKAEILNSLIDHIECSRVQSFLSDKDSLPLSTAARVVIKEILSMYSDILAFLHSVVQLNTIICFNLLQDQEALDRIVRLFSISCPCADDTLQNLVYAAWESVCRFLVTLLQKQGQLSVPSVVEETVFSNWSLFTGVFKSSLRESKSPSPSSLRNLLLKLLGLLLTLEGKRCTNGRGLSEERGDKPAKMNRLNRLLDTKIDRARGDQMDSLKGNGGQNEPNGESNACTESTGSEMCRVLLDVYEHAQSRSVGVPDEERGLVPAVLSSLLALSKSAKDTALQAGFVETSLEHIKHVHVQLNMNSLQLEKGPSWKEKEDPLVTELMDAIQLLRNFIHCSPAGKTACLESGIIDVLHKLWSWCTVEPRLLIEVLRILSTLTAQFPKASAYIAGSSGVPGSVSRTVQSGSTFLHSLIKLTNKTNSKLQNFSSPELDTHLAVLRAMFNLLSNLALSAECRGVMWKTNFLQPFSSLKPLTSGTHPKQRSVTRIVTLCWLSLLVNVTFFTDGQQGVVKTPGVVEVLLELSGAQNKQLQEKAILVLRNLCFHGASKPVLLVNEKLLSLLVDFTTDSSIYLRALCLSALCSLVHNCQKAKVSLKKTGIVKKLEEIKSRTGGEQASIEEKYSKICYDSVNTLQKMFSEQR